MARQRAYNDSRGTGHRAEQPAEPVRVTVLHEYGAPRHFLPLRALERDGSVDLSVHIAHVHRRFARACLNGQPADAIAALSDGREFARLPFESPQTIIFGFAPYHPMALYLLGLKQKHRLIYFTSWPHWGAGEGVHHNRSRWLRRAWMKLLDGLDVVSVTEHGRQNLEQLGARAVRIPHAVDVPRFIRPGDGSQDATTILYAGRLVPEKGMEQLEKCIHAMSERPVRWLFAGEGPMRRRLLELQDQGLPVEAPGYLSGDQLMEAFGRADLFVLPSFAVDGWEELFGISVIEAFAAGLPAVVTDCVGPREIVEDGHNGLIIPQRDGASLQNALVRLVEDVELRAQMSRNAREDARRFYDLPVVAEQWRQVLTGARNGASEV